MKEKTKNIVIMCLSILVVILTVVLSTFVLRYDKILKSKEVLHGTYNEVVTGNDYTKSFMTFNEDTSEYYLYVNSRIVEQGKFRKSDKNDLIYLDNGKEKKYIVLNDKEFYYTKDIENYEVKKYKKVGRELLSIDQEPYKKADEEKGLKEK